jgi:hypothetical protein
MPLTFLPTTRDEVPELTKFLTGAFQLPADAPFVEERLLEWKYFAPHPEWTGPRSYALRQDAKFAAHGCAHPVAFLTRTGVVTSMRVIDWAAIPEAPGSGVLLFRRFAALAETLFAVEIGRASCRERV